ncbi:prepilin peptidase [Streptomyces sp. NPDC004838]
MYATLIAVAALWGAAAGLLVPRAAYRLSVEPEEAWRDACPAGHPFTRSARGWLGGVRCPRCATKTATQSTTTPTTRTTTTPATKTAAEPATGTPDATAETATPETETATVEPRAGTPDLGAAPPLPAMNRPAADTPAADAPAADAPAANAPTVTIPLVTALACAALAAASGPRPELAVWLALAPVAVLLALVDLRVHRLPDQLTLTLAAASAVLLGAVSPLPGTAGSWPTALLGGLALGGAYLVLFLIHPNGLGFGDVKLALSLGVVLGWYGWTVLLAGAFAGFLLGSLYGAWLMAIGRAGRKTAIPFGPFMIIGALVGLLLGASAAFPADA